MFSLNRDHRWPSGGYAWLVASLPQHILFEILLTQVKVKVAVVSKIAPGMSLETPLNGFEKVGL